MDCLFCGLPVRFDQNKMAHRIFDVSDAENKWWLCRDCAEIRNRGDKTKGISSAGGTYVDCEEEAAYAITLLKKTPPRRRGIRRHRLSRAL